MYYHYQAPLFLDFVVGLADSRIGNAESVDEHREIDKNY